MFGLKIVIVLFLCFSNLFVFSNESIQTVNVDNFPPSLTLTKGSTVLFIVGLNTGDHIIFTKETPPDVKPFTSPVLNFNRLQPSFSYTFTDIGKYIIMDMYTLEKMNLTIIEKSSTTTSITTSTSFEGSTNSLTSSSISSSNHTISSLENNSLNNSTTTTPTSHEKNVSLKLVNSFNCLLVIIFIILMIL